VAAFAWRSGGLVDWTMGRATSSVASRSTAGPDPPGDSGLEVLGGCVLQQDGPEGPYLGEIAQGRSYRSHSIKPC